MIIKFVSLTLVSLSIFLQRILLVKSAALIAKENVQLPTFPKSQWIQHIKYDDQSRDSNENYTPSDFDKIINISDLDLSSAVLSVKVKCQGHCGSVVAADERHWYDDM